MKAKLRLYFETSIWRRLVDSQDRRRPVTYQLATVARRKHFILASRLVVNELGEIPDPHLRKLALDRFERTGPGIVTTQPRIKWIAEELLARGGWGPTDLADMTHVGYAVIARADVLVTWDVADLAREKTRRLVAALGREWGFPAPDLATPREVLQEWLGIKTL